MTNVMVPLQTVDKQVCLLMVFFMGSLNFGGVCQNRTL